MGAEIELLEDESTSVFSTARVRARLNSDPRQAIKCFRDTLNWGQERLYGLFHDGTSADALVRARSHLVDEVLRQAWKRFFPDQPEGLTLIAVGGYGRGELLPYSDIDLLLLHSDDALSEHKSALESLFAFFWDIGLEIGSAVRTVSECVELATHDITVITNLIEARLLCGDERLLTELSAALTPDKLWPVDAFFQAKLEEQQKRHAKYDNSGYKLEPNVKEGPGGLRDIQTLAWVCKRHFGQLTLTELRDHGFLTKAECNELFAGQDMLWRVRFALHMITGRHEDRLLFDHQIKIAELFGYVDGDHNRAVEQFMQLYYRTIKTLFCLNDMLTQLFEEAILRQGANSEPVNLNPRFRARDTYLEVRDENLFKHQPTALLEAFSILQKHPEINGIRAQTLRLIRRDSRLLAMGAREGLQARRLFIGMFQHGDGLTRTLRRMNRYDVLGRYLPEFGQVVGHMQYDLFHTLTVDEHSLYVVRNLRRMAMPEFANELPFFTERFKEIARPELLYLAGLFHDLGKGQGGDHSTIGAERARRFCSAHGLSSADADLVQWLVANHLTMSLTAQREDISDLEVVLNFAHRVGSPERLKYLLLLTVADIRATNPKLWNGWRESLLKDLYFSTLRALERGLDNPISQQERCAEQKRAALEMLDNSALSSEDIDNTWARFDDDYFLRHSADELAWHLPAIMQARDQDLPLILARTQKQKGSSTFIYMRDRAHIFAVTAGILAKLGLSVLDARINTTVDGYTLDSWMMMESDGTPITSEHRLMEIREALHAALSDPECSEVKINRRPPRSLKHFDIPTTVHFGLDTLRNRTTIELVTMDRPGLLATVGRLFDKRGIRIDAAKIATIGERVEDMFYVTDENSQPLTDSRVLASVRAVMQRIFDKNPFN